MVIFRSASSFQDKKRENRFRTLRLFVFIIILLAAMVGSKIGYDLYKEGKFNQIEIVEDSEYIGSLPGIDTSKDTNSVTEIEPPIETDEQGNNSELVFDETEPTEFWAQALKAEEAKDYEKAISLIDKILVQHPESKWYEQGLSKKEIWLKAIESIKQHDVEISDLFAKAETLKNNGQFKESLACLSEILKFEPGSEKAEQLRLELTKLIEEQEKKKQIETLFTQSTTFRSEGLLEKSLVCITEILQIEPENSRARELQSELANIIDEKKKEAEQEGSVDILVQKAIALDENKNWSQAIDVYNQVLSIKPDDEETRNRMLTCQHNLYLEEAQDAVSRDDLEAAINSIQKALSYKEVASTRTYLESTQDILKKREAVERIAVEVAELKNSAILAEEKGDITTALKLYEKVQELIEDQSVTTKITSLKQQIEEHQKREKFNNLLIFARENNSRSGSKEALDALEEALTLYPDNNEALVLRAEIRSILPPEVDFHQELILKGHKDSVTSAVFSPDGKLIVSGSHDRTVRIWDSETGRCLKTLFGHTQSISVVAFSPDGVLIASGDRWGHTLKIWNVQTGACIYSVEGHSGDIHDLSFSPDGKLVVTAGDDKLIKIWDIKAKSLLRTLKGHSNGVFSIRFSPDGETIVSGSWDKTVRIWKTTTGECIRILKGHRATIESLAISPDGSKIASCDYWDGKLYLWDTSNGACLNTMKSDFWGFRSVNFSPYGNCIVSGDADGKIQIWDLETQKCLKTIKAHKAFPNYIESVVFSPDGKHILSTGYDHSIRIWSLQ
jgi:WD40 repeat protein